MAGKERLRNGELRHHTPGAGEARRPPGSFDRRAVPAIDEPMKVALPSPQAATPPSARASA